MSVLKIGSMYALAGGGYAVMVEHKCLRSVGAVTYAGVYPLSGEEHHGYYTDEGLYVTPCGNTLEDDPFQLTGPYVPPKELYAIKNNVTGELYSSMTGPVMYASLEIAQERMLSLSRNGWHGTPVLFLEQDGVR